MKKNTRFDFDWGSLPHPRPSNCI